jgi:hypothetical protein
MNHRPPHDIVRAVREELATPGRYHLSGSAVRERSWLQIALRWIYERYSDFAHALSVRLKVGPHAVSIFGDLVVVGVVLLVAVVAARLLISIQLERSAHARAVALGPARSANALARAATEAAAAGDYALATRLTLAAAVTLLDLRGHVRDDASATINELRRRLRGMPSEPEFTTIARAYTSIAYAEEPAERESWDRARAAYERLSAALQS